MAAAAPFFSIIVPTYRRPAQLAACVEAMPHPGDPVPPREAWSANGRLEDHELMARASASASPTTTPCGAGRCPHGVPSLASGRFTSPSILLDYVPAQK